MKTLGIVLSTLMLGQMTATRAFFGNSLLTTPPTILISSSRITRQPTHTRSATSPWANRGWQITSITEYFTARSWPASFDVVLNIFAKSGPLPLASDNPTTGSVHTATLVRGANDTGTVSGLNILLGPGDYWIGFTPVLAFGSYGQEWQLSSSTVGDFSAYRNPGGYLSVGTEWVTSAPFPDGSARDLAFEIHGELQQSTAPEPGAIALLGSGIVALYFARRRSLAR